MCGGIGCPSEEAIYAFQEYRILVVRASDARGLPPEKELVRWLSFSAIVLL